MHRLSLVFSFVVLSLSVSQCVCAADAVSKESAASIRDGLEGLVEAALKPGELDDIVAGLHKPARDRMEKYADGKFPDLDAQIDEFLKSWKAKYKKTPAFSSEKNHEQILNYTYTAGADAKHATVTIPAAHGLPEVKFEVVNEVRDNWMIAIDAKTTGEQLKDRLVKAISALNAHKDSLPEDVTEAYRLVAHHVFVAISNTPEK